MIGRVAVLAALLSVPAFAADETPALRTQSWSFDGVLGRFDGPALLRGYQVYDNVCSNCHALSYVAYRNLTEIGVSEAKAKTIAAAHQVTDGPNDAGDMFKRPALLSDRFVAPFANDNAARAVFGALPPDLSLIVKARKGGPDYVYSLLTGFTAAPADVQVAPGLNYNEVFPGHQIAMPPPLSDGAVQYADGTPATVDQMSKDVVQFLEWTAEPKLEDRKRIGLGTMIFLVILAGLFFATKRKVWAAVH